MNMLDNHGAAVGTLALPSSSAAAVASSLSSSSSASSSVPSSSTSSLSAAGSDAFVERFQRYQALRQAGFDEETSTKYSAVVFGSVNEVIDNILSQTLQQSLANYVDSPAAAGSGSHFALFERGVSSSPPLSTSPSSLSSSASPPVSSHFASLPVAGQSSGHSSLSSSLISSLSSSSSTSSSSGRYQYETASMLVAGVLKDGFGSDASCEDEAFQESSSGDDLSDSGHLASVHSSSHPHHHPHHHHHNHNLNHHHHHQTTIHSLPSHSSSHASSQASHSHFPLSHHLSSSSGASSLFSSSSGSQSPPSPACSSLSSSISPESLSFGSSKPTSGPFAGFNDARARWMFEKESSSLGTFDQFLDQSSRKDTSGQDFGSMFGDNSADTCGQYPFSGQVSTSGNSSFDKLFDVPTMFDNFEQWQASKQQQQMINNTNSNLESMFAKYSKHFSDDYCFEKPSPWSSDLWEISSSKIVPGAFDNTFDMSPSPVSNHQQAMFMEMFENPEEYSKYCSMFQDSQISGPSSKFGQQAAQQTQQPMSYSQAIVSHDGSSSGSLCATGSDRNSHCVSPTSGSKSGSSGSTSDETGNRPTNLMAYKGLWVCNVSPDVSLGYLKRRFRRFGHFTGIQTFERRATNGSNIVFVHYDNPYSPVEAIGVLHNYTGPDLCADPAEPLKLRFAPSMEQSKAGQLPTLEQARKVVEQSGECFNWRLSSGCHRAARCQMKHILINKEVDSQPWVKALRKKNMAEA